MTLKPTQLLQNASFLKTKNWRPDFFGSTRRCLGHQNPKKMFLLETYWSYLINFVIFRARYGETHDAMVSSAIAFCIGHTHTPPTLSGQLQLRNFKRPKNREDSSDFDDFLTESIATALAIIFLIFESPFCKRTQKNYEMFAKIFEKMVRTTPVCG